MSCKYVSFRHHHEVYHESTTNTISKRHHHHVQQESTTSAISKRHHHLVHQESTTSIISKRHHHLVHQESTTSIISIRHHHLVHQESTTSTISKWHHLVHQESTTSTIFKQAIHSPKCEEESVSWNHSESQGLTLWRDGIYSQRFVCIVIQKINFKKFCTVLLLHCVIKQLSTEIRTNTNIYTMQWQKLWQTFGRN